MVGYTMIGYGVCGGFSSWISGILCQYVGRVALISAGRFCSLCIGMWSCCIGIGYDLIMTFFQHSEINAFSFPAPFSFLLQVHTQRLHLFSIAECSSYQLVRK